MLHQNSIYKLALDMLNIFVLQKGYEHVNKRKKSHKENIMWCGVNQRQRELLTINFCFKSLQWK